MLQLVILLGTELTWMRLQLHGIERADQLLHADALGDCGEACADSVVAELEEREGVGAAVRSAGHARLFEAAAGHGPVSEAAAAGAVRGCLDRPVRGAGDAGVDG